MTTSLSLLQTFVRQMRRGVVEALLTLPKNAPTASSSAEQRHLEQWLFDRESRWTK